MRNEILLLLSVLIIYGSVILWFFLFGKNGLYGFTVFATIAANIEVLILVKAFGLEQTLGNVMFAATFLVTDILSEISGKKDATRAVNIGILTSITFIVVSQVWMLFEPAPSDFAMTSIKNIFSNTPRIMIASLLVYAISQKIDVFLYHMWWEYTKKKSGNSERFLWLRNNFSTLISQFINAILYNLFAFWGIFSLPTLLNVIISTYIIYIVTSLLDTPFVYWARLIHKKLETK